MTSKTNTTTQATCSHCTCNDLTVLFQTSIDPFSCICQSCIIKFSWRLIESEPHLHDMGCLEILSNLNHSNAPMSFYETLDEIKCLSPTIFEKVCNLINYIDKKFSEEPDIEPPQYQANLLKFKPNNKQNMSTTPEPPDIIA